MNKSTTLKIADIEFDRVEYHADADVLYLHIGDPSRAVDYDETPEGHAVRFDRDGELVGLTLIRPKRLLERDGDCASRCRCRASYRPPTSPPP